MTERAREIPESRSHVLSEQVRKDIGAALGRVPSGLFVLTARHEDRRGGILCSWVQQVCFEPPMISVAIAKGRPIMPLISESRRFGLCQLPKGERTIFRKFAAGTDPGTDPFLSLEMVAHTELGVPILTHVLSYMECELTCHLDVEGDHDLFIGQVRGGKFVAGEPQVHVRENGFKY